MARPKPTVLLEHTDRDYRIEQVIVADAVYAVFYKDIPINLKSFNGLVDNVGAKYKKTAFSNQGYAFNLAERLNKKFNTSDFKVVKLTHGQEIQEPTDSGDHNLGSPKNPRV